jgi:hypothetical protein
MIFLISEILSKYQSLSRKDQHHRFKSWEHCYKFFLNNYKYLKKADVFDHGCLHLGFYLVSCGLIDKSSVLLQKDYKVHGYFLANVVMNSENNAFFEDRENGPLNYRSIVGIDNLIADTRKAYQDHIFEMDGQSPIHVTDTLASSIIMGVYGNTPGYNRYLKKGLNLFDIRTQFNEFSIKELVDFYNQNMDEFHTGGILFSNDGVRYTPMKLVDMYFWQIGYMMDHSEMYQEDLAAVHLFAEQWKSAKKKLNSVAIPV